MKSIFILFTLSTFNVMAAPIFPMKGVYTQDTTGSCVWQVALADSTHVLALTDDSCGDLNEQIGCGDYCVGFDSYGTLYSFESVSETVFKITPNGGPTTTYTYSDPNPVNDNIIPTVGKYTSASTQLSPQKITGTENTNSLLSGVDISSYNCTNKFKRHYDCDNGVCYDLKGQEVMRIKSATVYSFQSGYASGTFQYSGSVRKKL